MLYTCQVLLHGVGESCRWTATRDITILSPEFASIPLELAKTQRAMGHPWIIAPHFKYALQHRERKHKQGKHAGVQAKLYSEPHKPLLRSTFLAKAWFLINKMDYLWLHTAVKGNIQYRTPAS